MQKSASTLMVASDVTDWRLEKDDPIGKLTTLAAYHPCLYIISGLQ